MNDTKHVVLFNIGEKLRYRDSSLNIPLLECLFQNGIRDIYLFTTEKLNSQIVEDGNEIVRLLEEVGMVVHGVVTPSDLTWSQMRPDECVQLYTQCCSDRKLADLLASGVDIEEFVMSHALDFPCLARAIASYAPYDPEVALGAAFGEATLEYSMRGMLSVHTRIRSTVATVFYHRLAEKLGYKGKIELLLDFFLRGRHEMISGIVIVDNATNAVESVEDFPMQMSPLPLVPHAMPTPVITPLYLTNSPATSISSMTEVLDWHFEKAS